MIFRNVVHTLILFTILITFCTVPAAAEPPLLGRWTFDNTSQLGEDSSGNGLDGTVVNAVATTGRPLAGGGNSGAIALDGDDYVEIPNAPSVNGFQTLTVTAWAKVDGSATNIFRIRQPVSLNGGSFQVLNNVDGTGWETLATGSAAPTGVWMHIAGVFDRGETRIYIGGQLSNVAVLDIDDVESTVYYDDWSLGARLVGSTPDQFFVGALDEVSIYQGVLSAAEILKQAQTGAVGTTVVATSNGVAGDGVTDDATAIQNLLTTWAGTGADIFFPSGIYRLSQLIEVPDGVMIHGEGDTVFKPLDNSGDAVSPVFLLNDVEGVTLRDFQVWGNASVLSQNSGHAAIIASGVQRVHIDSITVADLGKTPEDPAGVQILLDAWEPGTDVRVQGDPLVVGVSSERNVIENCVLADPLVRASFGIRLKTDWLTLQPGGTFQAFVRDNVIKGNRLEGMNWNAIEIAGPATQSNLMRGNISLGAPLVGIEADKGASYNTFVDNVIQRAGEHASVIIVAIRDQGYPGTSGDHIATGNVFRRNLISGVVSDKWAGGIYLSLAQDGIFEDNFIRDVQGPAANKSAAILFNGNTVQNYIRSGNQTANVPNLELTIP